MRQNRAGFTLLELLVSIGIFAGLVLLTMPAISKLGESRAVAPKDQLVSLLSSAARHARNGINSSSWGLYLPYNEESRFLNEVILFSGDTYATRNTIQDIAFSFDSNTAFTTVDLSGSGPGSGNDHEIVFSSVTGETSDYGTIDLTFQNEIHTVTISPSGFVTTTP